MEQPSVAFFHVLPFSQFFPSSPVFPFSPVFSRFLPFSLVFFGLVSIIYSSLASTLKIQYKRGLLFVPYVTCIDGENSALWHLCQGVDHHCFLTELLLITFRVAKNDFNRFVLTQCLILYKL